MRITGLETFLVNAGIRNYLFVRLSTNEGITGIGEASRERQEKTVQTLIHEWAESRILGEDPFDVERVIGDMIRDQYQGGSTAMAAISGIEIACWDIVGKVCDLPIYKLLGGRCRDTLPAYANGWYGKAQAVDEFAAKAEEVVAKGYRALKFDPFGTAWKELSREEMDRAQAAVAAVRKTVGREVKIMVEVHGRLSVGCAVEMGRRLAKYAPAWYEEPVTPNSLELLKEVKEALPFPVAAGERLYTLQDLYRLTAMRAADVVQLDIGHCGGIHVGKKVAAMAEAQDMTVSPHCSTGPVALCAALHFDFSTPNARIQECFAEFDVPWRNEFVGGWNPLEGGVFRLSEKPGLGIELDEAACRAHPYQAHSFTSLWDEKWLEDFTYGGQSRQVDTLTEPPGQLRGPNKQEGPHRG
jgi:galactonate dehydratase